MKPFVLFCAGIAALILQGCGTAYYYAEFIHPSKTYIPAKIYHVGIVDKATIASTKAAVFTSGIPFESVSGLPQIVAHKTIEDLKKKLIEIGRYNPLTITWPPDSVVNKPFSQPAMHPTTIDSLCRSYGIDGLIVLEAVELSINTRGSVDVGTTTDPAGMPVRVPEFTSQSQVTYTLLWRFYDNLHSAAADSFQETYQLSFTKVAYTQEEAMNTDPKEMNLSDVANLAALDYFQRISPYWKEDFRIYYQTGSPAFYRIGQNLDYDGNWEVAATEWEKFTDNAESSLAYKAYYNLAVAGEMMGNPRKAKMFLEQALEIKDTRQAKNYMAQLKKQILIYDVVNAQLGNTKN